MKLLAIETSTEACSVALWIEGQVRERYEVAPRRHTELVLPWADELLAEAGIGKSQLDAIAVGRGPGAFTGVRLAIALAQGMAMALDKPVVAVSTLAALAMRIPARGQDRSGDSEEHLLAAIDARMGEVYLGMFRRDAGQLLVPIGEEWMASPADPQVPVGHRWLGAGTGFAAGDNALVAALGGTLQDCDAGALPHAADVARLAALAFGRGEAIAPELIEPAYLRNNVALTLAQQRDAQADKRAR